MDSVSNTWAIDLQNLSRIYDAAIGVWRRTHRRVLALDDVSFSIPPGELFGLVGPNGAGKTTLIKILSTLLLPTSGRAYVLGMDVACQERPIRERVNVVFGGERGLYTRLSGEDNLKYFADLYRVPRAVTAQRVPQLLELVGLKGRERERVEGYSRGMKQRLHIAKSLVNDPEVLFLDEPTIGLDPGAARKLRAIINDLRTLGKTIILTSHYMHEVDALCERVAVINKGRLLTIDSPYNLKRHVTELFIVEAQVIRGNLDDGIVKEVRSLNCVENAVLSVFERFQTLTIQTYAPETVAAFLKQRLPPEDIGYLITREPTLEDAYIKLVGTEA
jgi:ABC-2 type transport system ATP-binding protein